jgi:hypothetical protein
MVHGIIEEGKIWAPDVDEDKITRVKAAEDDDDKEDYQVFPLSDTGSEIITLMKSWLPKFTVVVAGPVRTLSCCSALHALLLTSR